MTEAKMKTGELLQKLLRTSSIARFIKRYTAQMQTAPLHVYLKAQCEKRGVIPAQVIARAGIERTFGHHIFNGRKQPSRDKVIQLAFGYGMGFDEAQELLKTARKSGLYPKILRDAVIIHALNTGVLLQDVQTALVELKLPELGKGGKV